MAKTFTRWALFRRGPKVRLLRRSHPAPTTSATALEVTVGQRTEPGPDGEPLALASYAGLPPRHLFLVADGSEGPIQSRQAAQTAAYAVTARLRGGPREAPGAALRKALWEAHGAILKASDRTHAEGRSGAGMVAVWLGPDGLAAARTGGGQAFVLSHSRLHPLFPASASGHLGDAVTEAAVAEHAALTPGARLLLMNETAARAVADELEALCASAPPQLAAVRIAQAARRRGVTAPLAVLVAEAELEVVPKGVGALLAKLGTAERERRGRLKALAALAATGSWWGILVLAVLAGALVAALELRYARTTLAADPAGAPPAAPLVVRLPAPAASPLPGDLGAGEAPTQAEAAPATPQELPLAGTPILDPDPASAPFEESLEGLFQEADPDRAARALRRHLRLARGEQAQAVYDGVSQWLRKNPTRHGFEVLAHLATLKTSKRTREWARELLIELYGADSNR